MRKGEEDKGTGRGRMVAEEQKGSLATARGPVAPAGPKPFQRLSFPGNSAKVAALLSHLVQSRTWRPGEPDSQHPALFPLTLHPGHPLQHGNEQT